MKQTDLGQVSAGFAVDTPTKPTVQTDLHWLAADIEKEAEEMMQSQGEHWQGYRNGLRHAAGRLRASLVTAAEPTCWVESNVALEILNGRREFYLSPVRTEDDPLPLYSAPVAPPQGWMRRVVCAANRVAETDALVLGPRHWDTTMRRNALARYNGDEACFDLEWEQGFIDQKGIFMTREEAWKVAEAAGQIIRRVGGDTMNGGHLFSENLY